MNSIVVAEHNNQQLNPVTLKVITAAKQLGDDITVIVIGHDCAAVAAQAAKAQGVSKVIQADAPGYQHQLAENVAPLVADLAKQAKYVLAPATTFGKNFMPRVAALLDVAQLSEVIEIIDADTFKRPIYAGNGIATVKSSDPQKVMTVRSVAFAATDIGSEAVPIETIDNVVGGDKTTFVKQTLNESDRPELTAAKVVISGGRGLQSGENFKILEKLADVLGAAIGASRAAVDAGYVPNDYQVGQTGKIVAPELYIAVGISGAIQHLAGMKESKIIVAINKDEEAPIFQVADYGIVGDLFEIVPKFTELLSC